uniref:WW domain-containing protein n=1 Tax=Lotharella globosa TaxID=91324 RepID=A0A7S3Z1G9_9EUKA
MGNCCEVRPERVPPPPMKGPTDSVIDPNGHGGEKLIVPQEYLLQTPSSVAVDGKKRRSAQWARFEGEHHCTIYYNETTGETRSEGQALPTEYVDREINWMKHIDEETGFAYYRNLTTGETTWDRPLEGNIAVCAEDNAKFRSLQTSRRTSFQVPETPVPRPKNSGMWTPRTIVGTIQWMMHIDEKTGAAYYTVWKISKSGLQIHISLCF